MKYIRVIDIDKGDIELNYIQEPEIDKNTLETKDYYSEQKVVNIYSLLKEIERLTAESTKWESKFYDEVKKVDKAIEYIENEMPCLWEVDDIWEDIDGNYQHNYKEYEPQILLNKLKGEDE